MSQPTQFNFSRLAYGLKEGVGVNASYNVQGYVARQGSSVHCFASGSCAARESRSCAGTVTAYDANGKEIGNGNFGPLQGPP